MAEDREVTPSRKKTAGSCCLPFLHMLFAWDQGERRINLHARACRTNCWQNWKSGWRTQLSCDHLMLLLCFYAFCKGEKRGSMQNLDFRRLCLACSCSRSCG